MSKGPPPIYVDDRIGYTARQDYEPMTPPLREALKAQPREIRRGVEAIVRKKRDWNDARG